MSENIKQENMENFKMEEQDMNGNGDNMNNSGDVSTR